MWILYYHIDFFIENAYSVLRYIRNTISGVQNVGIFFKYALNVGKLKIKYVDKQRTDRLIYRILNNQI